MATQIVQRSNLARAPVGGSDFACMFWRFLMMTWALSLVPIMAMSVRILFTSPDFTLHVRCLVTVYRLVPFLRISHIAVQFGGFLENGRVAVVQLTDAWCPNCSGG